MRRSPALREVFCNTSPLQYLHQLGQLRLLHDLAGRIVVPPAVVQELSGGCTKGLDLPDIAALDCDSRRPLRASRRHGLGDSRGRDSWIAAGRQAKGVDRVRHPLVGPTPVAGLSPRRANARRGVAFRRRGRIDCRTCSRHPPPAHLGNRMPLPDTPLDGRWAIARLKGVDGPKLDGSPITKGSDAPQTACIRLKAYWISFASSSGNSRMAATMSVSSSWCIAGRALESWNYVARRYAQVGRRSMSTSRSGIRARARPPGQETIGNRGTSNAVSRVMAGGRRRGCSPGSMWIKWQSRRRQQGSESQTRVIHSATLR